ncbi:MAG: Ribose import ATP-binding protein RbsA [Verrucomicrobia subdivision 3 bacterium]|nr:Ribose import ATP-binding protein RbsA [Limisphaerales bacterium]MCS1415893.1 Ribose import ATP-binding protein RbsA [Limisphaerales bacterium]
MSSDAHQPLLEVVGVSKRFPGVLALDQVGMRMGRGEIVAVIGENGAGKSTLMKILAGVQLADSGEVRIEGVPVEINSVGKALNQGIALIHQELNLADNLDVGANIFLGREPRRMGLVIDKARITRESAQHLKQVGLEVDPDLIVSGLAIGRQQMVEIAKALSVNARVLIMDEPTSSLSQRETEQLFVVIKDLAGKGVSIVYISHRLGEVEELADRVVVLRDGKNAGELNRDEISHDSMVKLMVGREVSQFYPHEPHEPGEVVLEIKELRTLAHPNQTLSFAIRRGEIVGVFGLVGAGRTEMLQTLFGVTPALDGVLRIDDTEVRIQSPRNAIRAGLTLVPEDRKQQGLILEMAVRENMSLATLRRDQRKGFLNHAREREISSEMVKRLNVKTPSEDQIVRLLSGGNQQKVVLGKWLARNPKVLLLDEPTRGIDVGAKAEIYSLMEQLAKTGVAILFVSSEMEEILGMSDRTLVMHEGRITGELSRSDLNEENVMRLATGQTCEAD